VRVADLFQREHFAANWVKSSISTISSCSTTSSSPPIDFQQTLDEQLALGEQIKPLVTDVTQALQTLRAEKQTCCSTGAQGAMLDVGFGHFIPFVTFVDTTASFAGTGTGLGPRAFDEVWVS